MRLFRWEQGRQTDIYYRKFCFFLFRFFNIGMDAYILKYDPQTHLKKHTDPVKEGRHYRLNIVLKGKGVFYIEKTIFRMGDRVVLFRPDIYEHSMINSNSVRKVLSIGLAIYKFRWSDYKFTVQCGAFCILSLFILVLLIALYEMFHIKYLNIPFALIWIIGMGFFYNKIKKDFHNG